VIDPAAGESCVGHVAAGAAMPRMRAPRRPGGRRMAAAERPVQPVVGNGLVQEGQRRRRGRPADQQLAAAEAPGRSIRTGAPPGRGLAVLAFSIRHNADFDISKDFWMASATPAHWCDCPGREDQRLPPHASTMWTS
jgi:hypothetical protein